MVENRNYTARNDASLSYKISTKCVKLVHMKPPLKSLRKLSFIAELDARKQEFSGNFYWKSLILKFKKICPSILALIPGHRQATGQT
jgi:hypothetical protein